jgi:hypothetical protein
MMALSAASTSILSWNRPGIFQVTHSRGGWPATATLPGRHFSVLEISRSEAEI